MTYKVCRFHLESRTVQTNSRRAALPLLLNYHLSVLQVVVNIGKFSYFIGPFSPWACRFEVDSPRPFLMGRVLDYRTLFLVDIWRVKRYEILSTLPDFATYEIVHLANQG